MQIQQDDALASAILETVRLPLLALDPELRVETANNAFLEHFQVTRDETLGRLIYELGNGQWDIRELRHLLSEVLPERRTVSDYRVEHEFERLGRRVMHVSGRRIARRDHQDLVLLAISDDTEREALRAELTGRVELADKLIDSVREGLLILKPDLSVHSASGSFYNLFEVNPKQTVGRLVYELGNGQWNIPQLRQLLEDVLPRERAFDDYEVTHVFDDIGKRVMVLNGRRLDHMELIVLAIRDITHIRESDARFKEVTTAARLGVFEADWRAGTLYWSPEFRDIIGYPQNEPPITDPVPDFIHPEDRSALARLHDEVRHPRGSGTIFHEHRIIRPNGEVRWVQMHGRVELAEVVGDRSPMRVRGVLIDVTEKKTAELQLRESEERLSLALTIGGLGTWDWDLVTGAILWSDEHFRMEGYEVGEVVPSYEAWIARVHPEDRAATERALTSARDENRLYQHEFRSLHPDGSIHWLDAQGRFFYDSGGHATRMLGVMRDITEQKRWADTQAILVAELQHRTRNLLGVVRSISEQTLRTSDSLPDFAGRFGDRLAALSRVQGLLSHAEQEAVSIGALVHSELDALGATAGTDRIITEGPQVRLRNRTVQTLALALHELATNARKYGALSGDHGHLSVTWTMHREDGGELRLVLRWIEDGIHLRREGERANSGGYGRELIEKALPYSLGAKTSFDLTETGLHCCIDLPVSKQQPGRE
ncbi:PAS domain-containing protein [Afifella sp. JA880]|uniref:PAS domain-containing sensor histidine kinase n=1 Tax=Afifella sp. JA880 TaxID=2975280 RepID=UPI0021BB0B5C|nr:PAS domain-containing protein [Afifella sp. JA880]MCT8266297.1 PAS domain-containing protein [Afifella sp. JA880]